MDKEQEKKINTTHEDQPAKEHLKVKSIVFWNSNLNCRLEQELGHGHLAQSALQTPLQ